jgi:peptidoglycan hydrolase-like protein with peptidoglycan-binding domain
MVAYTVDMKKAFLTAATIMAFTVSAANTHAATVSELQAQLQTLMAQLSALQTKTSITSVSQSSTATSCPNLIRILSRGTRGTDVMQLQQFLVSQKLLATDAATGFFGALTESALKQWQSKNGIASSGTPATTGWGSVGPKTRAALRNCKPTTAQSPSSSGSSALPRTSEQGTSVSPTPSTSPSVSTSTPLSQPQVPPSTQSITSTTTSAVSPLAPAPATLAQYWMGKAEWQLEKKLTNTTQLPLGWPAGYGEGSQIVVGKGGAWYLFHRHVYNALDTASMNALWGANTEDERKKCGFSGSIIGTDIRKSTDQGVTWSDPRPIVWPAKGSPWECMGGDGGAHYDASTDTWRYLSQCMALTPDRSAAGKWNGCTITFNGADPVKGPDILWTVPSNPVAIQSGSLLERLCANTNSACARLRPILPEHLKSITDEGTFDIVEKKFVDGQWWWYVTMHGFDGVLGYRGLAKTIDFVNWKIGSDAVDLPNDFIGSAYTAGGWNETWQGWTDGAGGQLLNEPWNIGTGAARILKEGTYYYEVIEASDKNLVCVPGQKWNVGILRTNNLANATWEQFPQGNPIFKSSELAPGLPCGLSYANIFRAADGTTYLHVHVHSATTGNDGIYLYKLIAK